MGKKNLFIFVCVAVIVVAALIFISSTAKKNSHSVPAQAAAVQNTQQQQQVSSSVEDQEEPPTVEIPPDKQQLIGVKTVAAGLKPLQKIIRTVGSVEYDERRLATVNTKFEGWIEKLFVDYTGKYIRKGEPIAEIYSPELLATEQELINLLKW
ncbi:MAG TPA: efflux RND transporter periplasmic adaptor subunit, partial [Dissulfurispiraceae bacterium]|nr:efflux RND transporter periplasmic adaptor subunit [Dissulfurispiraceae bacterium]